VSAQLAHRLIPDMLAGDPLCECPSPTSEPVIVHDLLLEDFEFGPETVCHLCVECIRVVLTPRDRLAVVRERMSAIADDFQLDEGGNVIVSKHAYNAYIQAVGEAKAIQELITLQTNAVADAKMGLTTVSLSRPTDVAR
jgi:hypothetical protein